MCCGHVDSSQKNRRTDRRRRKGTLCQGRSATRAAIARMHVARKLTTLRARSTRRDGLHDGRDLVVSCCQMKQVKALGIGKNSPWSWHHVPPCRLGWTPLYHRHWPEHLLGSPKVRETPGTCGFWVIPIATQR